MPANDQYHLIGGVWKSKGKPDYQPGQAPVDPQPPLNLQVSRVRTTSTTVVTPPTTDYPYFGACPPGGETLSSAQNVVNKYGTGVSIRQFKTLFSNPVTKPAGCSVIHTSWKISDNGFTDAQIAAGAADSQLSALIQSCPNGSIIELNHESDNDGLTGTGITNRVAAKSRLWTLKQAIKPGVLVAHTFVGFNWDTGMTDTERNLWMNTAKGDLIGLDYDGIHDKHLTAPPDGVKYVSNLGNQTTNAGMTSTLEITNIKRYLARSDIQANGFIGWTVPEFGTTQAKWDTTGGASPPPPLSSAPALALWIQQESQRFIDNGAYAVQYFDFNGGTSVCASGSTTCVPGTTYTLDYRLNVGTAQFDTWNALCDANGAPPAP